MIPSLLLFSLIPFTSANYPSPHSISSQNTCLSYQCATTSNIAIPTGSCGRQVNNTVYLQPCSSSAPYCQTSNLTCIAAPVNNTDLPYPGEPCISSCKFGTCKNNYCFGAALLESCTSHEQCNPGLRCGPNNQCVAQINIGDMGCRDFHDCVNWATCNWTYGTSNGVCNQYATISNGDIVTDCTNGFSYLCQSGFCKKSANDFYGSLGVCSEAPVSTAQMPTKCSSDMDCEGSDGDNIYLSSCTCGYNSQGAFYCQPFIGDAAGLSYISTWVKSLQRTNKCNTVRRSASGCLQFVNKLDDTTRATWEYLYYPQLQNNDQCVQATYNYPYYYDSANFLCVFVSVAISFLI
ncbi:unnamed protein product [Blepharisma stoltei]|uniref:Uncharacterized protein n=1 Tax=Blepharisma stoltei TaxID=1481888 RepID=A0AAU9K013_9CILI|nr:unnamed protein product [Blepharisma stoltei]